MNSIKASLLNINCELIKLKCNQCQKPCQDKVICAVLNCNYILPAYNKNIIIYYIKDNGNRLLVPLSNKDGYLLEFITKDYVNYVKIRTGECSIAIEYKKNKVIRYKKGKYEIVFLR